jgi:hypothetical protein
VHPFDVPSEELPVLAQERPNRKRVAQALRRPPEVVADSILTLPAAGRNPLS